MAGRRLVRLLAFAVALVLSFVAPDAAGAQSSAARRISRRAAGRSRWGNAPTALRYAARACVAESACGAATGCELAADCAPSGAAAMSVNASAESADADAIQANTDVRRAIVDIGLAEDGRETRLREKAVRRPVAASVL